MVKTKIRYKTRCNCRLCPHHAKKWAQGTLLGLNQTYFTFIDSAGNLQKFERKDYWIDYESIGPRGGKKWMSIFHHEIQQRQLEQDRARKQQTLKRS